MDGILDRYYSMRVMFLFVNFISAVFIILIKVTIKAYFLELLYLGVVILWAMIWQV